MVGEPGDADANNVLGGGPRAYAGDRCQAPVGVVPGEEPRDLPVEPRGLPDGFPYPPRLRCSRSAQFPRLASRDTLSMMIFSASSFRTAMQPSAFLIMMQSFQSSVDRKAACCDTHITWPWQDSGRRSPAVSYQSSEAAVPAPATPPWSPRGQGHRAVSRCSIGSPSGHDAIVGQAFPLDSRGYHPGLSLIVMGAGDLVIERQGRLFREQRKPWRTFR